MDSDVVLRVFLAGASLSDLSTLTGAPTAQLEQFLREAYGVGRAEVAPARPFRLPPEAKPTRTRLRADEIDSRVLVCLKRGGLGFGELAAQARLSRATLNRALARLTAADRVTKNGRVYRLA